MVLAAHFMDAARVLPSLHVCWLVGLPRLFPGLLLYACLGMRWAQNRSTARFTTVFTFFFSLFVAADTGNSHYTGAKTT